jgi:Xaa-Pro aminopeptidase
VAGERLVSARVDRLRGELERLEAASFLVSNPVNVRWLTGFASSNAALVVRRDVVLLLTDGRYLEAARAVEDVEVVPADRELMADIGRRLSELAEPPVAFEADHVTVAAHEALSANGTRLAPATNVVVGLRAVKDAEELETLRRAARISEEAYARLAREPFVGRTEAELAWAMERFLHEEGADAPAFPTIVAAGPNAARPHHDPGERRVEAGETVIVDAGVRVDGYCSDCTRTFATGRLPDDLLEAYALCRSAQETALAAVRAGASGQELDAIARTEIDGSGLAVLQHGLGHGVGLEVHERPVLRPTSEDTLAPGNVVTVEPGVYLAGRGGVRIEDLVVVGADGIELLTPFTKDLLTLD